MTLKEKAQELVNNFLGKIPFADTKVYADWKKEMKNKAKECALIAVDLIIYHTKQDSSNIPLYEYYKEVKKEIEKL